MKLTHSIHGRGRRRLAAAALTCCGVLAVGTVPAQAAAPTSSPRSCQPQAFGARGDGRSDDTVALQRAIDACAAKGGGTVGLRGHGRVFLTGPIQLRSHVTLEIDKGVTLRSVADRSRFTWAFVGYTFGQSAGGDATKSEALITAKDATDVAIKGGGTIDGQGAELWWSEAMLAKQDVTRYKEALTFAQLALAIEAHPETPSALPAARYAALGAIPTSNGLPRPWLVEFYGVSGASVSGVTLTNSPMWSLGLRYSSDVSVSDLVVRNPEDGPNTDGVDLVSTHDVTLTRLDISTGDDNVAIKSGFPGFPTPAVPTTDVTITDSVFGTGHGLSIGSEASNGVQRVRGTNLAFTGTDNGFRIKSGRDRGADLSDIEMTHLTMTDVAVPLYITDYYTGMPKAGIDSGRPITSTTPFIHDIAVRDLVATGAQKSLVVGLPEAPLKNIDLTDVHISDAPGGTGMQLRNVQGDFTGVTVAPGVGPAFVIEEGVDVIWR